MDVSNRTIIIGSLGPDAKRDRLLECLQDHNLEVDDAYGLPSNEQLAVGPSRVVLASDNMAALALIYDIRYLGKRVNVELDDGDTRSSGDTRAGEVDTRAGEFVACPVVPMTVQPPVNRTQVPPEVYNYKTRVCKYFAQGDCRRGPLCTWLHPGVDTAEGVTPAVAPPHVPVSIRPPSGGPPDRLFRGVGDSFEGPKRQPNTTTADDKASLDTRAGTGASTEPGPAEPRIRSIIVAPKMPTPKDQQPSGAAVGDTADLPDIPEDIKDLLRQATAKLKDAANQRDQLAHLQTKIEELQKQKDTQASRAVRFGMKVNKMKKLNQKLKDDYAILSSGYEVAKRKQKDADAKNEKLQSEMKKLETENRRLRAGLSEPDLQKQ